MVRDHAATLPTRVGSSLRNQTPERLHGITALSCPYFPKAPAGLEPGTGQGDCCWHWQPGPYLQKQRMYLHSANLGWGGAQAEMKRR